MAWTMQHKVVAISVYMLLVTIDAFFTNSFFAKAATTVSNTYSLGKTKLSQGKYAEAIKLLELAAQTPEFKNNCDCHLCLGQAYCSQKNYVKAKQELRMAIRLGKGSANAQKANQIMITKIPHSILKPKLGEGTQMIAALLGISGLDRGPGGAKPKVFEFYADWCQPCKLLKPVLAKAKEQYAGQIEFVSYNVDDAKNEEFINQYEVSPIPTIIFLTSDNEVVGYSIGFSGEQVIVKELKKILPKV